MKFTGLYFNHYFSGEKIISVIANDYEGADQKIWEILKSFGWPWNITSNIRGRIFKIEEV